jgi:hypothetical protein
MRKYLKDLEDDENIFYLMSESDDGLIWDVWFVNNSNEVLTSVSNSSGGFATVDDDVIPMTTVDAHIYRNVQPKEAVLIDEYDVHFDGDFMITFGADVTASSFGSRHFSARLKKGEIPNAVLYKKPL